ncbi:MAG: cell division protein ZapE [Rhizobiales bacterium]|nr:cell division protein ZapE [Hyphomicrobiales bacterium]MBI3672907.1 cell division protein ZapE [Hyphomicrobiales bacterium]
MDAIGFDAGQEAVARELSRLAGELAAQPEGRGGIFARLRRPTPQSAPEGLYIHGEVGRGKTMLMDLFFAEAAVARKRRVHFHAFMQDVHARLHAARKTDQDAIAPVAAALASEATLLCLDETQIADIADAMIVGRLFEALFARGVVLVTTANFPPEELYRNGLNRQLFLPFIALLRQKLAVVALDGSRDYRQGRVKAHETFVSPLGPAADARMEELWQRLTDSAHGEPMAIDILGRRLQVPEAAHACARFTFADLCEAPLGPADFLAIARQFRIVFVERIPALTAAQRNEARRFITLIDALYDAKVKLVASSAQAPEAIYPGGEAGVEFARTASRLREMQSAGWWGKKIVET